MAVIEYTPPATLARFMRSNARVRIVRGPVGSGKSTAAATELLRRAAEQAPGPDGVRRSRGVIVRNTLQQLESTALETIMGMYRSVLSYRPSDHVVQVRMGDVHADWILMPLDRPENVQRLLSLELTYAWLSEIRELPPQILRDVLSRCGRFPSMMHGGPSWYGVWGETNSFSEDSEWFKELEQCAPDAQGVYHPKANWDYFVQPGARDPGAENLENLTPTYYADLIEANSTEWVEQYVDNRITPSLAGEAVFRASFNREFHIANEELEPVPGALMVIGLDFGRTPTAVVTQMDPRGRILVLDECFGDNMGIEKFLDDILRPLVNNRYLRFQMGIVGDPAGISRTQVGEESVFDAIKRKGFAAQPAQTNNIEPRLRAVEKWLVQQRDGKAALLVSPRCANLIRAMSSMYRYGRKKDGSLHPTPEKTHPWSDLADALQYAVLGHSGRIASKFMRGRVAASPPKPVEGWT